MAKINILANSFVISVTVLLVVLKVRLVKSAGNASDFAQSICYSYKNCFSI